MKAKHGIFLGILGLAAVTVGTRAASAGNWGSWATGTNIAECSSPTGYASNGGDSDPQTIGVWVPDTGFTDQIRGQARNLTGAPLHCTWQTWTNDGISHTTISGICGEWDLIDFRCQTRRL